MERQHWEEASSATRIKDQLYLQLSEQWHFCFDISTPQHCPCSKMIEPSHRSGFYHGLVFHPPWMKCKPQPLEWEYTSKEELEEERRMEKSVIQIVKVCLCAVSECAAVLLYVLLLLSDGDLLTCRDREKADCTVTLLLRYPPVPLGKSEKKRET